jgi:hypothetical protein
MIRTQALALVNAVLLTAGCASIPEHQDVQGPEAAKLRLRMADPPLTVLSASSMGPDKCAPSARLGWVSGGADHFHKKRVGMLDSPPIADGVMEVLIEPNKELAVFSDTYGVKTGFLEGFLAVAVPLTQGALRQSQPGFCKGVSFVPRPRGQYEIVFAVAPGTCKTTVFELTEVNGSVVRNDITSKANYVVDFSPNGGFSCRRQSQPR